MTREEKAVIIGELSEKFAATPYFYITDTGGLTVAEVNAFRRLCFQRGLEYRVVKNTLIAKALETTGVDYSAFNGTVLKGLSGVIFSPENPKTPAKLIKDFKKEAGKDKIRFKGASIEGGLFIGEDQLVALENVKSKQEMIGDIIGLLQSPAKNVVSALQSSGGKLAGILKTLSEREG
ncbi:MULTISPECIES: 50S ribosomal protein L10 [Bacteroidota]|jgi:large subunit ribosomal protein L10|uniref:Large ribosomal subunit protein uL10 n=2 Tax=Flectobacillus TaxID=101 RepID=A0ABT6Z103_9BACT|nr:MULTISPECIES: 50S ribosomal protein L10 [Bacteroidota]NBA74401.1 50S ribosomal protein L10 [Emticicia sp. ODNR4P]MDI9860285.1 50S ribosomal protein L10 [Flectobacillus roseus]MDI9871974.1 50S ribosomal protein L10 [Flectobacillus roseus]MDI9874720.1 50S ribosomal protein L10 [Flectobacillus rivi]MDI9881328.1 50S ribosomal protein L10 [Flectobacillus longus]